LRTEIELDVVRQKLKLYELKFLLN